MQTCCAAITMLSLSLICNWGTCALHAQVLWTLLCSLTPSRRVCALVWEVCRISCLSRCILSIPLICQVPPAAGKWPDSGVYSGSVLQAEIQPAAEIPPPAVSAGRPGTEAHISALGGEFQVTTKRGCQGLKCSPSLLAPWPLLRLPAGRPVPCDCCLGGVGRLQCARQSAVLPP